MDTHITKHRVGFDEGYTPITAAGELHADTGINFGILKLKAGTKYEHSAKGETALVQLAGTAELRVANRIERNTRQSLFDDSPFCVHVAAETTLQIQSLSDSEWAVCSTANTKPFPTAIYLPNEVSDEHRGKGQVQNACLRLVRTIFDGSNAHPDAELVIGEVVNLPGRWSSYPPHHHPQPEIYHYRFTQPQGYGHAELGEAVLKVRQGDTVKILDAVDHSQCSAPGYGMWYLWVIRHLPGCRYTIPTFTEDHIWTQDPKAAVWTPNELASV